MIYNIIGVVQRWEFIKESMKKKRENPESDKENDIKKKESKITKYQPPIVSIHLSIRQN